MEWFVGSILAWAVGYPPRGWALCEGQLLLISENTTLFALIGTIYGGDGVTNFALPHLRGRVPVGQGYVPGLTPNQLGYKMGRESIALSLNQLPNHTHESSVEVTTPGYQGDFADTVKPKDTCVLGKEKAGNKNYSTNDADSNLKPFTATGTSSPVGGGALINAIQPCEVEKYIICLNGLWPPRS